MFNFQSLYYANNRRSYLKSTTRSGVILQELKKRGIEFVVASVGITSLFRSF